jgi:hypothetical protein
MKKILFTLLVMVGFFQFNQAQEIGIRFGDAVGGNYAVDGVISLAGFSRIHADVSFGDGVGVEALWDFIYKPLGEFNWYVGVGAFAFLGDPFQLGVSGELGLEYHFDFPLAIGADWRPSFRIVDDTHFSAKGFGVNVRYVIN